MNDQYCTVAELKAMIGLTSSSQDTNISNAIDGASRQIDQLCGRNFYITDSATDKYFNPQNNYYLDVPDIANTTNLVIKLDTNDDGTHDTTLTENTDFYLKPINTTDVDGDDNAPFGTIEIIHSRTSKHFDPKIVKNVKITAFWGFPQVPQAIKMACLLQASRLWKRKDSPFGTYGSGDTGKKELFQKFDPDAKSLIMGYKKRKL